MNVRCSFSIAKSKNTFLVIIILTVICFLVTLPIRSSIKRYKVNNNEYRSFKDGKILGKKHQSTNASVQRYEPMKRTYLFYRTDASPENTVKLPFLKNYRNPCWRELCKNKSKICLRCLPYFFVVGAPKCGTTDLFRRLTEHPLISKKNKKENHWLTRQRFKSANRNLSSYLEHFDNSRKDVSKNVEINNFHPMIFGEGSASTLWDNRNLLKEFKDRNMKLPLFTNADIIRRLNPSSKIVIILRNPVTRLYSEYLYFKKSIWNGPEEFHKQVISSLHCHDVCIRRYSLRYCSYFLAPVLRINVGFYYIYIEDYFRVFPHEQIKIIKLEHYSQHMNKTMRDLFYFLGLAQPSDEEMVLIIKKRHANANDRAIWKHGEMFQKTQKLLNDFYKPWNEKLVELLGEHYKYP